MGAGRAGIARPRETRGARATFWRFFSLYGTMTWPIRTKLSPYLSPSPAEGLDWRALMVENAPPTTRRREPQNAERRMRMMDLNLAAGARSPFARGGNSSPVLTDARPEWGRPFGLEPAWNIEKTGKALLQITRAPEKKQRGFRNQGAPGQIARPRRPTGILQSAVWRTGRGFAIGPIFQLVGLRAGRAKNRVRLIRPARQKSCLGKRSVSGSLFSAPRRDRSFPRKSRRQHPAHVRNGHKPRCARKSAC